MVYDKTTHHRRSVRLSGYDYSIPGLYFVTICTADKKCLFGYVFDGKMILNKYGITVRDSWNNIPGHFPRVKLHEFVIMPNHMHGIIEIIDTNNTNAVGAGFPRPDNHNQISQSVGRGNPAPTLGNIVGWFKYQSTKHINNNFGTAGYKIWQRSYYEHIICNNNELDKITNYIFTNPQTWDADVLFQKQLDAFNSQFN